jgi:SP family general alpha glucoside:H+ symporter-like MFS transporter
MSPSPKDNFAQVEHIDPDSKMGYGEAEKPAARAANDREHTLTLRDSLRLYPKAIAFSLLFSTAIIMEGYDLSLLGSFYGYDA